MPIFTNHGLKILFIHIPKTAGTSIENFFEGQGWRVDFLDRTDFADPASSNFVRRSSPQHHHLKTIDVLVDRRKFDFIFSVVRHPLTRFTSEFAYRNPGLAESELSPSIVEDWWFQSKAQLQIDRHYLDNHLRPQVEFVDSKVKVYRFESELDAVARWISELSNPKFAEKSLTLMKNHNSWNSEREIPISRRLHLDLVRYYWADFLKFGYSPSLVSNKRILFSQTNRKSG